MNSDAYLNRFYNCIVKLTLIFNVCTIIWTQVLVSAWLRVWSACSRCASLMKATRQRGSNIFTSQKMIMTCYWWSTKGTKRSCRLFVPPSWDPEAKKGILFFWMKKKLSFNFCFRLYWCYYFVAYNFLVFYIPALFWQFFT